MQREAGGSGSRAQDGKVSGSDNHNMGGREMTTRKGLKLALSLLPALATLMATGMVSVAKAEYANPFGVAVIIGNRDYGDDIPAVSFAHRDAEAFRRYVIDVLGFDPENIIDLRDATQAQMWSTFGSRTSPDRSDVWAFLDPDGSSDVVVYYSGHGVPGVEDKRGYLLPVDANPNTAEINGYPIDVLYQNLASLTEARSVAVYLDACFSGGSGGGGMLIESASPVYVGAALPETSEDRLAVLTAATGKQLASWDREAGHGMFTHHLLDALYGKGDADADGQVTAREAKAYLDRHMTRAARRTYKRRQNASFTGNADTVLAAIATDIGFPARPTLEPEAGEPVAAEEAVAEEEALAIEEPVVAETPSAEDVAKAAETALDLKREERASIQRGLAALGFNAGAPDGIFGPKTRRAIQGWQASKGFPETRHLDAEQAQALISMGMDAELALSEAQRKRKAEEEARVEAERQVTERLAEAQRAADEAAFQQAKALNTAAAFQQYLAMYPNGIHAVEARALLDQHKQAGQILNLFLGTMGTIMTNR